MTYGQRALVIGVLSAGLLGSVAGPNRCGAEAEKDKAKVVPSKEPKALDFVNPDGKKIPLIYALEGDRLRLALPPSSRQGFTRPTSFDSAKSRAVVLTAERQKE